jgi:type VI secretion system protein ImpH
MESLTGSAAPDIIQTLTKTGGSFNFFQAVALCEEYLRNQGNTDPLSNGTLRFYADPSLAFPPSDIASIQRRGSGIAMMLAFMGLVGASSPLPVYFTEYCVRHPESSGALTDFLAIFNHRFYALFYQAWQKDRLLGAFASGRTDALGAMLMRLAGVTGSSEQLSSTRARTLTYAGMLASKSRSALALSGMLSDFFNGIPCTVRQFCGRWAELPSPSRMGVDAQLGVNALTGTAQWNVAGKFAIRIGPLSKQEFEQFLPGSARIGQVKELVGAFLVDPLEFDLEIVLAGEDLVPVVLGEASARLGETSSLGKSEQMSSGHTMIINCN